MRHGPRIGSGCGLAGARSLWGVEAYAIVQRVPNATPRLRLAGVEVPPDVPPAALESMSSPRLEAEDPEGLADRVAAIRAALAQTTWYLFNPDGWR